MNVLIVEDVTLIAERIERLSKIYLKDLVKKIQVSHSLEDARFLISEERFDLVFLDLNLNGENGFDLLRETVAKSFKTIVITANKSEAARAFDLGIFDFISKPITKERFKIAIDRLMKSEKAFTNQSLSVKSKGKVEIVKISDIVFIKASGHYSELHCKDSRIYLHDHNLEKICQFLPASFQRAHRSYILDTNRIRQIFTRGAGKYEVEIEGGLLLPVNKDFYKSKTKT